ncbi:IS630 family transposase [Streptomyces sp. MMS24-I29]|uniref:IS630 family transposase n=1 Tax=Streptomyces sp. MMS24-I29 TaxID=3351480 RepID=UPI003C7C2987
MALRARIVLWAGEGRRRKDIAELAGVSARTVDRTRTRYAEGGVAGLVERKRGGGKEQVPPQTRGRVIALTRMTPPPESGLSHWSTRTLADYLKRREGIKVSFHYVARIWREENLKPHRSGTFKLSKDPAFAEKVADIVGLYLDPPGGAVVLSVDEKTQVQALDRTQPVLPVAFAATEKRTHDYVRHGITNLFAALNIATGEGVGECKPNRNGANFLAFLKKAVEAAEQYFSRLAQPREQVPQDTAGAWTSGPEGSTRARPTIDSAVLAVLAPGEPMALADIYAGVAGVRPGTKNNNIRSSLDRLRRVGRVERAGVFRQGLYRIADPEKAGPAHN